MMTTEIGKSQSIPVREKHASLLVLSNVDIYVGLLPLVQQSYCVL